MSGMRFLLLSALTSFLFSQTPALRIVVIEGEDAVNIVQQKTAVRPLVEVRDRNNVPVAGATVTFTIGGGQPAAFAGGVQTLTVTTNAAGQAAATGFNVVGPGAIQVQVQAAYQGQIATAAISQTNFATAAAASQAGAAGGGGGGISGTTIGIIGGAVAGGAVAATQLKERNDDGGNREDRGTSFTAPVSGQIVVSTTTGNTTCVSTRAINGSLKITLAQGNATGTADMTGALNETSFTSSPNCSAFPGNATGFHADVTGGPSNLTFLYTSTGTGPTPTGGSVTATEKWEFKGSFSSGSITGTLSYAHQTRGSNPGGSSIAGDGSTSFALTLR